MIVYVLIQKKYMCLPVKLCVYLNSVCKVQQISYAAICKEQMVAICFN